MIHLAGHVPSDRPAQDQQPGYVVIVNAFVTNPDGEVLLVRAGGAADTWEMPGGRVAPGETLHQALQRVIHSQAGIAVAATGVTGVYQHASLGTLTMVFRARARRVRPHPGGATQAAFHRLDAAGVERLIAEPQTRSRIMDAMRGISAVYEAVR